MDYVENLWFGLLGVGLVGVCITFGFVYLGFGLFRVWITWRVDYMLFGLLGFGLLGVWSAWGLGYLWFRLFGVWCVQGLYYYGFGLFEVWTVWIRITLDLDYLGSGLRRVWITCCSGSMLLSVGPGIEMAWGDLMHDLYLGVGQDVCGSALVELFEHGFVLQKDGSRFPTADEGYRALHVELKRWCYFQGIKCPPLALSQNTLGRNLPSQYPALASSYKAAHVKIMISFCAHICWKLGGADWRSKVRTTCLYALSNFIHILDRAGPWLTDSEADDAYYHGSQISYGMGLGGLVGFDIYIYIYYRHLLISSDTDRCTFCMSRLISTSTIDTHTPHCKWGIARGVSS